MRYYQGDVERLVLKICFRRPRKTANPPNSSVSALCRYVSRPPVASERLALTASGQVRYTLKTPYRDGNAHCAGAAGSDGAPRGAGAEAADALDAVSRRIGPEQSVSGGGDAGASGQGCGEAAGVGR